MLMHVILHLYIYTEEDCYDLQMDLDSLTQYMWQIIIHLIHIARGRILHQYKKVKYLGVVIDQHLGWNEQIATP